MRNRQRLSSLVAHVAVVTPSPIRRTSSVAAEPRAEHYPEPPRATSLTRPGGALSSLHTQAAAVSLFQTCAPPQRGWQLSAKESPWWTGPPRAHARHAPNVLEAVGQREGYGPLGCPAARRTWKAQAVGSDCQGDAIRVVPEFHAVGREAAAPARWSTCVQQARLSSASDKQHSCGLFPRRGEDNRARSSFDEGNEQGVVDFGANCLPPRGGGATGCGTPWRGVEEGMAGRHSGKERIRRSGGQRVAKGGGGRPSEQRGRKVTARTGGGWTAKHRSEGA